VEAQLPRTANLSNQIQLDQIAQQYLQAQLNKYTERTGGGSTGTSTSSDRSPTSTEARSPTSTSTEVRSPTSTSTEVRSPTSTSTDAYTQGNVTVTGGAGAGATTVYIGCAPEQLAVRADRESNDERSRGSASRMERMIQATSAPRVPGVMPALMDATSSPRVPGVMPDLMNATSASRPELLINELMKSTSAARPVIPIKEMMNAVSNRQNNKQERKTKNLKIYRTKRRNNTKKIRKYRKTPKYNKKK
jgi:hypothetical protein